MEVPKDSARSLDLLRMGRVADHENLIKVFRYGRVTDVYYYIDMQLCAFDLEQYISERALSVVDHISAENGVLETSFRLRIKWLAASCLFIITILFTEMSNR